MEDGWLAGEIQNSTDPNGKVLMMDERELVCMNDGRGRRANVTMERQF